MSIEHLPPRPDGGLEKAGVVQSGEPKTEPKTWRLGETIFPFRDGIREVAKGEETWSGASYLSRDDFPIEGIGIARVELAESLKTDYELPSKVIVVGENGQYDLADPPYRVAVTLCYDDADAVDPRLECHAAIGNLSLRAPNTAYSRIDVKEPNAGFSEWVTGDEQVDTHVVLDDTYEQLENKVLQDFSFRFERPQE